MKCLVFCAALVLAPFVYGAEELDPALQKQFALLEARAKEGPQDSKLPEAAASIPAAVSAVGVGVAPTAQAPSAATAGAAVGTEAAPTLQPKASENEIPVLTKFNKKVETDTMSSSTRVLAAFGIVIGILVGGLFFLRRYTRTQSGKIKHTQINVVAQHHLGPKKSLAIVRVAGESILLGVTDQSITMIKQLHILDEDLAEEDVTEDFRQRLERSARPETPRASLPGTTVKPAPAAAPQAKTPSKPALARAPLPHARQVYEADDQLNESDEFLMRGIRDIVSDGLRNRKTLG